jgi:hypothetical protein
VTRQPPQPPPNPPSGNSRAKAGYRPHRERGEAVAGHHADRPGDARSGPSQAGLTWAAGDGHDYTYRGLPPLPAWYYVLHGEPVPDDAPRTPPPAGFAELMAKRSDAGPDSDSDQTVRPGQQPGTGPAGPGGPAAASPAALEPARPATGPARRQRRRPRAARPATASAAQPGPPAEPPPPAPEAQWCGKCGYRTDAPGHKMTCLGQT